MSRPPFTQWRPTAHVSFALAGCLGVGWLAQTLLSQHQQGERQLENAIALAQQPLAGLGALAVAASTSQAASPELDPSAWPPRSAVDELVKAASETAKARGLAIRSLSVSHQPASANAWGKVPQEASASGTCAALKGWQSGLQAQFPRLAVQALRMQSAWATPAPEGRQAQWTWVMHVRD